MNRQLWTAVGVTLALLGGASLAPTMNWSVAVHAWERIAASGETLWQAFNSVPLEARLLPGLSLLLVVMSVVWIKHLNRSPRRLVIDLARRQLPTSAIARRAQMSQDAVRTVLLGDVRGGKRLRFARRERKILPFALALAPGRLGRARDRVAASSLR